VEPVPDDLPPGAVLDPHPADLPAGATLDPAEGEHSPNALGPMASAAVRPVARAASDILNFIPDMATDLANLIPESIAGPKLRRPSEAWSNIIDKYTTKPQGLLGRGPEEVSTLLLGGGATTGLERAAGLGVKEATATYQRITSRAAEKAHTAGYQLPPSYIGGKLAKSVQTAAGGPKLEKTMSAANEAVTDRLAQTELGLHPGHPGNELAEESFEALRREAYEPYEAVRQFGTVPTDQEFLHDLATAGDRFAHRPRSFKGARYPEIDAEKAPYQVSEFSASEALDEIRTLRQLSRQNLRNYSPAANALGYTQREIANALEHQIERAAKRLGSPDLLDRLRAARIQLSKIGAIEDSMGAGGHVVAEDLRRMMDKGIPLTGNLKLIAETAKNFPSAVQQITKKGETGVWSAVDYLLGGTGLVSGAPQVAVLSLARPVSRWALGTKPVQKAMIRRLSGSAPSTTGTSLSTLGRGAALETYESPEHTP